MSTIQERWEDEEKGIEVLTSCIACKHRITQLTCKAFLNGIPQVVLSGEEQHRTQLPGDHGIQFEAKQPRSD